jgi:hypothetical protein
MLPFRKWIAKSPFPQKSEIKYVHMMLVLIDQFCFQCGPRAKKELPTLALGYTILSRLMLSVMVSQ